MTYHPLLTSLQEMFAEYRYTECGELDSDYVKNQACCMRKYLKQVGYTEENPPGHNDGTALQFILHYIHREYICPGIYEADMSKKERRKAYHKIDKEHGCPKTPTAKAFWFKVRQIIDCDNCGYAAQYEKPFRQFEDSLTSSEMACYSSDECHQGFTLEQLVKRVKNYNLITKVKNKNPRCADCGFKTLFTYQGAMMHLPHVYAFIFNWECYDCCKYSFTEIIQCISPLINGKVMCNADPSVRPKSKAFFVLRGLITYKGDKSAKYASYVYNECKDAWVQLTDGKEISVGNFKAVYDRFEECGERPYMVFYEPLKKLAKISSFYSDCCQYYDPEIFLAEENNFWYCDQHYKDIIDGTNIDI